MVYGTLGVSGARVHEVVAAVLLVETELAPILVPLPRTDKIVEVTEQRQNPVVPISVQVSWHYYYYYH